MSGSHEEKVRAALEAELNVIKEKMTQTRGWVKTAESKIQSLDAERRQYYVKLEEEREKHEKTKQALIEAHERVTQLNRRLADHHDGREMLRGAEESSQMLHARISLLSERLLDKEKKISRLNSQLQGLVSKNAGPKPVTPVPHPTRKEMHRPKDVIDVLEGGYDRIPDTKVSVLVGFLKKREIGIELKSMNENRIRLLLTEEVEPGTKVRVRILNEKFRDRIDVDAEVRWCHAVSGHGHRSADLEIVRISESSSKILDLWLDYARRNVKT